MDPIQDEVTEPPIADAPGEDIWAEPTPTAMTDAAMFEEPEAEAEPEPEPAVEEPVEVEEPAAAQEAEPYTTDEPVVAEASKPWETEAAEEAPSEAEASIEAVSAGVAADASTPEEEPFERAGRWWFKRGSELLVYNEQTGEWVPSPTPLPSVEPAPVSRLGPDSSVTQTISDITAAEPEPEPEPEVVEPTAQQGFWKCAQCGAVNGSTAETCRMCFSARPA